MIDRCGSRQDLRNGTEALQPRFWAVLQATRLCGGDAERCHSVSVVAAQAIEKHFDYSSGVGPHKVTVGNHCAPAQKTPCWSRRFRLKEVASPPKGQLGVAGVPAGVHVERVQVFQGVKLRKRYHGAPPRREDPAVVQAAAVGPRLLPAAPVQLAVLGGHRHEARARDPREHCHGEGGVGDVLQRVGATGKVKLPMLLYVRQYLSPPAGLVEVAREHGAVVEGGAGV
mmetsp:Transcript_16585/g.32906  ORF Transcript_16585/g.32906 Transcript_16585/m.32906 type:complete len:227 (-) Transcript_16585:212-892(-)